MQAKKKRPPRLLATAMREEQTKRPGGPRQGGDHSGQRENAPSGGGPARPALDNRQEMRSNPARNHRKERPMTDLSFSYTAATPQEARREGERIAIICILAKLVASEKDPAQFMEKIATITDMLEMDTGSQAAFHRSYAAGARRTIEEVTGISALFRQQADQAPKAPDIS